MSDFDYFLLGVAVGMIMIGLPVLLSSNCY